jgi:hypothetical protein
VAPPSASSRTLRQLIVQRVTHGLFQLHRATFAPCLIKRGIAQCRARCLSHALVVALFVDGEGEPDLFAQAYGGSEDRRCPLRNVLCDFELREAFQGLRRGIRMRKVTGDREAFDQACFSGLEVSISAFGTTCGPQ